MRKLKRKRWQVAVIPNGCVFPERLAFSHTRAAADRFAARVSRGGRWFAVIGRAEFDHWPARD